MIMMDDADDGNGNCDINKIMIIIMTMMIVMMVMILVIFLDHHNAHVDDNDGDNHDHGINNRDNDHDQIIPIIFALMFSTKRTLWRISIFIRHSIRWFCFLIRRMDVVFIEKITNIFSFFRF